MAVTRVATPNRYVGVAADVKPTTDVPAGSRFTERDTGLTYVYDGTSWGVVSITSRANTWQKPQTFAAPIYSRAFRPTTPGLLTPILSIVFDDGLDDVYTDYYPILVAQGEVASIAINSSTIGTAGYLTWAQVVELYNAGWEVINHGSTHTDLTGVSLAAARVIIEDGKAAIESHGIPVYGFAWPYSAWNNDLADIVRESHLYARNGGGVATSSANPILFGTVPTTGGAMLTYALAATNTDDPAQQAAWLTDLTTATTNRQWAIFYWHEYNGATDATNLNAIIDQAQATAVPIRTMFSALDRVGNPYESSSKSVVGREGIVTNLISSTFGSNPSNQYLDIKGALRLAGDGTIFTVPRLTVLNSNSAVVSGIDVSGNFVARDNNQYLLGADSNLANAKGVLFNRTVALNANTVLAGVLIGTPVTPVGIAANSVYLAANVASGDILLAVNQGGTSYMAFMADASTGNTLFGVPTGGSFDFYIAGVKKLGYVTGAFAFAEATTLSFGAFDSTISASSAGVPRAIVHDITIGAGGAANGVLQHALQLDSIIEAGLLGETDGAGSYTQAKTIWKVPYRDSGAGVAAPTAPTTAATWLGGLRVEAGDDVNRIYFYANEAWHYVNQTAGLSITAEERVDPWTGHRWQVGDVGLVKMHAVYGDGGADFLPYPLEEGLRETLLKLLDTDKEFRQEVAAKLARV